MGRDKDAQFDSEFNHPPEARGPWANEVAEDRQRAIYCQPCKEKGRKQMAHRVLPGRRGVCNWCYRGEPHPEEREARAALVASLQSSADRAALSQLAAAEEAERLGSRVAACVAILERKEAKEEVMAEKCKCGRPQTHRGRCWVRRGLKAAPEVTPARRARAAREARQESKPVRKVGGGANGASEPVSIPVAALDRWFEALGERQREALLAGLWSQLPPELKAMVFAGEVGA